MDKANKQKIAELLKLIKEYEDMIAQAKLELHKYSVSDILKAYEDGNISDNEREILLDRRKSVLLIMEEVPPLLDDARKQLNEATKATLSAKPKKLGGWHIVISYIWLPLCLIVYILSFAREVRLCFVESFSASYPFAITYGFTAFCGVFTFISMIQQNKKAYYLIHVFCICLLYCGLADFITNLMMHETITDFIPIYPMLEGLILFLIHKYYCCRKHLLDSSRMGTIVRNIDSIIPTIIFLIISAVCIDVYATSVHAMFKNSVEYGLFGVCVPVISQFVFLFDTGFATVYAFNMYFLCLSFAFGFTIAGITELIGDSKQ